MTGRNGAFWRRCCRCKTLWCSVGVLLQLLFHASDAFVSNSRQPLFQNRHRFPRRTSSTFFLSDPDENSNETKEDKQQSSSRRSLLSRFTSPVIDDPGLPLADALVTQIVAPSLQIFWLSAVQAPSPSWLRPIFDDALWQARGSLVAPTLIHGAGLAVCWLAGALAAQAYRRDAIDPTVSGYGTIFLRLAQAGAFAVGLLILATQLDLFVEFGRNVQPGESDETDLRLLTAVVEMINDGFFEGSSIAALRFYLAFQTARRSQS